MKKILLCIACCLLVGASSISAKSIRTKPVKGTWINLFWQDERNNYMNPKHKDNTDPALWRLKIKELHEIGMEYIVIMAIANEGKAYYPSDFMDRAYPAGRESPVEAIMAAADEYDMKVFMSCGWAKSQLDNLRDPEIKATQLRIMEEVASKFSSRKSFFGWYLPVEDSFEPVLSDHAVTAVNELTARARALTPGKQIMISPYGLCNADMDSPEFAKQIYKLNVDIIAYQDEVGCVREPMPMKRMKEHFKTLGEIHKGCDIDFWANIESFTWDRETNSWYSTLVPAAFGRYLSQLTGVSQAGVENVLSFSIFGIYDKPGSAMPLGQPEWSGKAYCSYIEWLEGEGRWPFLEASFYGDVTNGAKGCKVEALTDNAGKLSDGELGYEDYNAPEWCIFGNGRMEAELDLGKIEKIKSIATRFLNYKKAAIRIPDSVDFYVSDNGKDYEKAATVPMDHTTNDVHDCWIDVAIVSGLDVTARYVKIKAQCHGQSICCDEIFVNPEY